MLNNIATWDRNVRIFVGLVLVSLVFIGPHTPYGWLGVVLVITGAVGFCPLYRVFGMSTCCVDDSRV